MNRLYICLVICLAGALVITPLHAQAPTETPFGATGPAATGPTRELDASSSTPLSAAAEQWSSWLDPERFTSSARVVAAMTVLSLAPAILLMTTAFIRIVVVLGLLRQAIGAPQLPPNQVITALAMFVTVVIMWPVWQEVYDQAIVPYTSDDGQISFQQAWDKGVAPVRQFMSRQIELAGNSDDVWLFLQYQPDQRSVPTTYAEVPLQALVPAFVLSELKTAFFIGFQIYLPFLIIDLVVATVSTSMGMLMLPPAMMSLPLKLLLFVLVDGWHLVVGKLLASFQP